MPAKDVKAYVKRNKNDAADAEAICEAVRRLPGEEGSAAGFGFLSSLELIGCRQPSQEWLLLCERAAGFFARRDFECLRSVPRSSRWVAKLWHSEIALIHSPVQKSVRPIDRKTLADLR
jgi:hypothetical protein